ncbi:NUDIX domain-containing protein [Lunatimonas salinarum]|uniref:NUDIX domain-containing protein n=1 Tax=Lunatimonas salinarum TaxID=1774590 RepID=UPI001AE0468E|nr:NUDIX domain-containing protein [Lunatimonas salinarum]
MSDRASILKTEILSDNYYTLKKVTYAYRRTDGITEEVVREAFDRGNGAALLLYHEKRQTVVLTKQFRLPAFISGHPSGFLIEVCAGMIDEGNPEETIKREAMEETGYQVANVRKVFEAFSSPGAVTEKMHFFVAAYDEKMKVEDGGGRDEEQEDIELLEVSIKEAMEMVYTGEIQDAKTILLLQHYALKLAGAGVPGW